MAAAATALLLARRAAAACPFMTHNVCLIRRPGIISNCRNSCSSSSSSSANTPTPTSTTSASSASSASSTSSTSSGSPTPGSLQPADEDALIQQFFTLAKRNDDSGVEELVESDVFRLVGDAVNGTDSFGNSPVMIASQRNWSGVITVLQQNTHCDVNHQNFFGSSALMCSASHGHLDALRTLCANGNVDINLLSRFGQTALMKAAQAGKLESIKILLDHGADPTVRNKQGKGAIEIAEEKGHAHVAEFLKKTMGS